VTPETAALRWRTYEEMAMRAAQEFAPNPQQQA
jgi:hypothetical protein